jgi:aminoglycoside 6-adenylyltransferase
MTNSLADTLTDRIIHWAKQQNDIRAVLLLGSRARDDHPADQWSDWDIVIICVDPEPYLADAKWLEAIAPVWLTFLDPTAVGNLVERRALFEGGVDADFIFVSSVLARQLGQEGFPEDVAGVVRRGVKVLLDKENFTAPWLAIDAEESPAWQIPSEAQFNALVQDFLYHGVWVTKKLRRGEMWTAKWCLDGSMKDQMLTMIHWHTRATQTWRRNLWHQGRFLEEWADERVLEGLPTAFARYDPAEIPSALKQTLYLFHWLAEETARGWQYAFPPQFYKEVIGWINDNL